MSHPLSIRFVCTQCTHKVMAVIDENKDLKIKAESNMISDNVATVCSYVTLDSLERPLAPSRY